MSDRRDNESMRQEMAEVAAREQAVRDMAMDLALALKAAHRIILAIPNDVGIEPSVWNNNWPTVDEVVNRLVELEEA